MLEGILDNLKEFDTSSILFHLQTFGEPQFERLDLIRFDIEGNAITVYVYGLLLFFHQITFQGSAGRQSKLEAGISSLTVRFVDTNNDLVTVFRLFDRIYYYILSVDADKGCGFWQPCMFGFCRHNN